MSDSLLLCRVDPGLVDHVRQLLGDAGLASTVEPLPDGRVGVRVAAGDDEHARAVIGLVLPELLIAGPESRGDTAPDEPPPAGPLSARLVRSEDPGLPGGLVDGRMTFGYADPLEPPADDDSEFVPPEPPPVPRPKDRVATAAWCAVIGGPLLLLGVVLVGLPGWLTTGGLLLFFGGFATLVFRHEERRGDGDGWDDGAVV